MFFCFIYYMYIYTIIKTNIMKTPSQQAVQILTPQLNEMMVKREAWHLKEFKTPMTAYDKEITRLYSNTGSY